MKMKLCFHDPPPSIMNPSGLLFRRCTGRIQAPFRQKRWAQVSDVRFYAARQDPTEKYREALERKAKEKGLKDAEELRVAYADRIASLRKEAVVPGMNAPLRSQSQAPPAPENASQSVPYQPPPPPQPQPTASSIPKGDAPVKTLSSFIDVEKTAELPHKEIETIWRLRHVRDAQSLCAVMQSETWNRIASNARKHPQFILPIPREGQGAEIHFLQWTFPTETTTTVLFTHLAEFKLRGEYAQPHTVVTHHLDLAGKGIVLMEGRVQENRGVSVDEGKFLLMTLQKFYGFEALSGIAKESAKKRSQLMQQFSGGDASFKVEDLLEEAEKVP